MTIWNSDWWVKLMVANIITRTRHIIKQMDWERERQTFELVLLQQWLFFSFIQGKVENPQFKKIHCLASFDYCACWQESLQYVIFLPSLRHVFCVNQWFQLSTHMQIETIFYFLFLLRSVWFPIEHILAYHIQQFSNRLGRALQAGTVCVCVSICICLRKGVKAAEGGLKKVKRERWRNDRGDL